jgi:lysophospholipase L1-like esterase
VRVWLRYVVRMPLLPWVVLQGRRLRRSIPDLPEAPGAREGIVGAGTPGFSVLSLGESPIAGVGLDDQRDNLLPILAERVAAETGTSVRWQVLGQTGIRLHELLPRFENELPAHVDFVFVAMGVNDCKDGTSMARWSELATQTLDVLRRRYPNALVVWSAVPPMHSFPALPQPVRGFLGARAALMNHVLQRRTAGLPGVRHFAFPDRLGAHEFARDGFHPNAAAHRRWAEAIHAAAWTEPVDAVRG